MKIAAKGLRQRSVSSLVAVGAAALACSLLMLVWAFKKEAEQSFVGMNGGFDAVLGPRGSKLQLVLNGLFHMDQAAGLMAQSDYEQIKNTRGVDAAYPIAVGDNYRGFRIVGTVVEYLRDHAYETGEGFVVEKGGRLFEGANKEAVVGSFAAKHLGLRLGDTFHAYHGYIFDEKTKHEDIFEVVGVLEPTGTPADRVLWVPLQGIQQMSGHDPNAATDVSAVLVKYNPRARMLAFQLNNLYNKQGNRLTLAWPVNSILMDFFRKISWFDKALQGIGYLVALIAASSLFAILYNAMNERKRDIAVLRALGARRSLVFGIGILESLGIAIGGVVLGFAAYGGIGWAVSLLVYQQTGVPLEVFQANKAMLWAPLGMLGLSLMAGVLPAAKAYRTDVARNL
ncbi:MAG: FtsX-like permease family protein [Verrucomicrobiota bacterium]